jgi:glycosyltransferase involved in cell wall biosynthesis
MVKRMDNLREILKEPFLFLQRGKQISRLVHQNEILESNLNDQNQLLSYSGIKIIKDILDLSRYCEEKASDIKADAYISHDLIPLQAINRMHEINGGLKICNVVENPNFETRTIRPDWDQNVFDIVNAITSSLLRQCDLIYTIGQALKDELVQYDLPVHVLPNYRNFIPVKPSKELFNHCSIPEGAHIVLVVNTISSNFENVINALDFLPEEYHLVTIGRIAPTLYYEKIHEMVKKSKFRHRIHLVEELPYAHYSQLISGASVGLNVLNIENINLSKSLPNRLFDYISGGVPIVTPVVPDIVDIVNQYQIGTVIHNETPEEWAESIMKVVENVSIRDNVDIANRELTWESLETTFLDSLADVRNVTFIGSGKLCSNNRTIRMTKSLLGAGKIVNIVGAGNNADMLLKHERLSYYFTDL